MKMLLAAVTQEEAIAAIRQQVSGGAGAGAEGSGVYAWMSVVALGLAVVLLVMRWRRGRVVAGGKRGVVSDPGKLVKELRKEGVLTRADVRALKREVARVEKRAGVRVGNPVVLALCPSLKKRVG